MSSTIWSWTRTALLASTISLAFGSAALAQDYDAYSHRDEAREQGLRRGYRDGSSKGEYDRDRGHRFNFKNDDWEDSRGFEHWMGSKGLYKQAYREGYENGYRRSYGYSGNHYRDRDDWR